MKKYLKYFLYFAIIMTSAIVLSSCQLQYDIEIECGADTSQMEGKLIDILLPVDEANVDYSEFHTTTISPETVDWEIIRDSDIVKYNIDGYKSMIFHTYLVQDAGLYGKNMEISVRSRDKYMKLCDDYECFRLALIDTRGNIYHISEEMPFKSSENYYLDTIKYDTVKNEVYTTYENTNGDSAGKIVAFLFMWIMPFISVILFLVFFLPKDIPFAKNPVTLVLFGIPLVPLVVYLFFRFDDCVKASINDKMAWEIFFDFGVSWLFIIYAMLPYVIFIASAFMIYYRRKKAENSTDLPVIEMK